MVNLGESVCPKCGGTLKYSGCVKRIVRVKLGRKKWIKIRRLFCVDCGMVHRELPRCLFPRKHYDATIIEGVVKGRITTANLDYEDYPCETTMNRWRKEFQMQK